MTDYQGQTNNYSMSTSGSSDVDLSVFADESSDALRKGYKLYNFRRPDKFSKEHLRALQDVHREFSRQLSLVLTAYLRKQTPRWYTFRFWW